MKQNIDQEPLKKDISSGGRVYQWGLCQLAVLRGSVHAQTSQDTSRYILNRFQYVLHEMCALC